MFCEHLANRAEFDRTRNVMHVKTVSFLRTILNAHEQPPDSKTVCHSDITEGQNSHCQSLKDTTANSQDHQCQRQNISQSASWGKHLFHATSSPIFPYTGQLHFLSRLGSASSGMNKVEVVQDALCRWVMVCPALHGSPCPPMMEEFEFGDIQESASMMPLWGSSMSSATDQSWCGVASGCITE